MSVEMASSSVCQPSEHQRFGLPSNNGAHVLGFESPPNHNEPTPAAAAAAAEPHDMPWQRLNSLTLDELSEELDRRTKETQRLQEEVENATKEALKRFGCSPGQNCHNHRFSVCDPSVDFAVLSTRHQALTQPRVCGQNSSIQTVSKSEVSPSGKGKLGDVMADCLQQLSDLHLNKTLDQPKQETFSFDTAIVDLRTQLHNVQMEKNVQSDLRLKDSRKHVHQMEKMLCMLEEVQNIKRAVDQKLQETEDEALALNRKVETLERVIKEMYSSLLSYEKPCGHNSITSPNLAAGSAHVSPAAPESVNSETDRLQGTVFLSVEHLVSEECGGIKKQKERIEDLIASVGQEMALLTDKLSSSKNNSINLSVKLQLLKKLAERQASLHQRQVSELQSALSCHKDKICCLEQQLIQAQSQLVDAQREKEQSLQQAEELQSHLGQLKWCDEQQQCELQVEVNALRGRLEVTREQLRREAEEKICLQALLEQSVQEGRKSQELLREKHKELQLRQHENQQHLSRLDEAHCRCQTLKEDGETLRLKLDDREKIINILRQQTESSIQMIEQHRRTIDNLQQENSLLSNQLNQHKLEIQQLTAELDLHKSNQAAAEREKQQLQASLAEQSQRVQEETLQKQQLAAQLGVQRMKLLTLTKEHKELHSCKKEEQEGVVLELQRQLRNARDELDQVRTTLRILEGADEHGLQVAMDMQKKITVRRQQVDSLQGKIQHLEEAVEKLHQEKRCQNLQNQQHLQQLIFVREEKRQLANELKALRSKDQQLRDRIGELEAVLHKTSQRFADCQGFIQLQEQEFFRLKLQHTLDLKELRGKDLHTALLHEPPPVQDSLTPSAVTAQLSPQQTKSKTQQENPSQELRSLVRDLQGVISQNRRPHTDNSTAGGSFHRRRSAPERVHSTAFSTDKAKHVQADSRLRRKTCGSEQHVLTAAELNGNTINKSFSERAAALHTSSSQLLSLGRRSPVHALLTSDPDS